VKRASRKNLRDQAIALALREHREEQEAEKKEQIFLPEDYIYSIVDYQISLAYRDDGYRIITRRDEEYLDDVWDCDEAGVDAQQEFLYRRAMCG
jgi:hypothetical protein